MGEASAFVELVSQFNGPWEIFQPAPQKTGGTILRYLPFPRTVIVPSSAHPFLQGSALKNRSSVRAGLGTERVERRNWFCATERRRAGLCGRKRSGKAVTANCRGGIACMDTGRGACGESRRTGEPGGGGRSQRAFCTAPATRLLAVSRNFDGGERVRQGP